MEVDKVMLSQASCMEQKERGQTHRQAGRQTDSSWHEHKPG